MSFRLKKINYLSPLARVLLMTGTVALALLFCGAVLQLMGSDPVQVLKTIVKGSFGSVYGIKNTLIKTIPLMFCALGVSVAFEMQIWNIGAEGQLCMGAFAATGVALYCPFIPDFLVMPAMLLAAFLGGALWGAICILPNALWQVNEIITTLMMNYIAIFFVNYFVYNPWRDPAGSNFPLTAQFEESALLPKMLGAAEVPAGLFIGIAAAAVLYFLMRRTTIGYEISSIGQSRKASACSGMDIRRNILLVMLISGGVCGLAGLNETAGVMGRLMPDVSAGYGYTAIIIAYLSKFNPLAVVAVSIAFGGMQSGAQSLQVMAIPSQIVTMVQGVILFFVLAAEFFSHYKIILVKKRGDVA